MFSLCQNKVSKELILMESWPSLAYGAGLENQRV